MANLGRNIDRKMIIVILYNLACAYQGIWDLEKCKKYIDGVIFNIDKMLAEEKEFMLQEMQQVARVDRQSKISKLKFLLKCQLQYCAVLS